MIVLDEKKHFLSIWFKSCHFKQKSNLSSVTTLRKTYTMKSSCSMSYQFTDPVEYSVDVLLSYGVVTAGVVICSIFLP